MTAQAAAIVFQAGQTPKMAVDGQKNALAVTPGSPAGTTSVSDTLEWGRGGRGTIGFWNGRAALLLLKAGGMSDAEMESMTAALVDPRKVYSVGAANRVIDPNRSPIAQPVFTTATAGTPKDINVAAAAYDPNGDPMTATDVTVVSGAATATVPSSTGGNVRVTGNPGLEQEVVLDFGIKDGGNKRSRGRVYASVGVGAVPTFPKLPPAATATLRVPEDYSTIGAALAAASAGDHISLADGTYAQNVSVTVSGSAAGGYIVIKARNHRRAVISGHWNVTGDWLWFTGLTAARPGTNPDPNKNQAYETPSFYSWRLAGKRNRVTNCRIDSPNGIWINSDSGFRTEYVDICFNDFTGRTAPRWNQANCIYMGRFADISAGCNNVLIARNRWYDDLAFTDATSDNAETRFCIYTGNSRLTSDTVNCGVNRTVRIWENYVDVNYIGRGFYCKRTYDFRRNYIAVNRGGGGLQCFQLRYGGYSKPDGTVFPGLSDDTRGWIEGNNFANGKVFINDTDHLWLGNRFAKNVEMRYGGRRWEYQAGIWQPDANEGWIKVASRNMFIGCQFAGGLLLGTGEDSIAKPYRLDNGQGGIIRGVKCYRGTQAAPTVTRLKDWDNDRATTPPKPSGAGIDAVAAGAEGYEALNGTNGYTVPSWITGPDLLSSGVGCDG